MLGEELGSNFQVERQPVRSDLDHLDPNNLTDLLYWCPIAARSPDLARNNDCCRAEESVCCMEKHTIPCAWTMLAAPHLSHGKYF